MLNRRPVRVALGAAVAAALLLASACTAPGGTTSGGPTPTGGDSVTTAPPTDATKPLTGTKKAAKVELPGKLDEWTMPRSIMGPNGQQTRVYLKPGGTSGLAATVSLVPLTQAALDAVLTGQQRIGESICGTLPDGTASCYVPLDGGSLSLTGSLPIDQLAVAMDHLYAALR